MVPRHILSRRPAMVGSPLAFYSCARGLLQRGCGCQTHRQMKRSKKREERGEERTHKQQNARILLKNASKTTCDGIWNDNGETEPKKAPDRHCEHCWRAQGDCLQAWPARHNRHITHFSLFFLFSQFFFFFFFGFAKKKN